MAEVAWEVGVARFGMFDFDPETGELIKQGSKVRLPEQPARILEVMLRREGRVVTRDERRGAHWPAKTLVASDHSLNTAVGKLRTARDDAAQAIAATSR